MCDAIRFAENSPYMTPEHVVSSLNNISASLKMGGYLLTSGVILRKMRGGWVIVAKKPKWMDTKKLPI